MRLCLVISLVLTFDVCFGYYNVSTRRPPKESSSMTYLTEPTRHVTIPIKVHFDKALTDKLAKEYKVKTRRKLKDISRSILKEVEAYFRHPSLNQSIQLHLLDTKFMRQSRLAMNDDGSIYLRNYCNRQTIKKKNSKKWWFSILLTGRDLFFLNERGIEVRSTTGRGYMGGVCTLHKSCAVVEWSLRNIGYLLAHEIGHSMGMVHDGAPYNECKPHINIMSSKYHPRYHPKTWSRCSKRQLERFMTSRKGRCLRKNSEFQRSILG